MHGNKKKRAPKQAPQPAETVKQQEKAEGPYKDLFVCLIFLMNY